jgi:N-methylhydantoinase A
MSASRLASGVLEIAAWSQVNAIRQVTVKKGLDPRDYALVSFGGSGPLQASRLIDLLGLRTGIVPSNPGNVSAFGLLAVDLKRDYVATAVQRQDRFEPETIERIYGDLERAALGDLAAEGVTAERRRLLRTIDIRYFGEAYEVRVPLPARPLTAQSLTDATRDFHDAHRRLYGYDYRGVQLTEIVNLRVTGIGLIEKPRVAEVGEGADPVPVEMRPAYFEGGFVDCRVYHRESLGRGAEVAGPAIIEEYGSTTVVSPGHLARVDRFGNLVLRVA